MHPASRSAASLLVCLLVFYVAGIHAYKEVFNVLDFGAVSGGKENSSAAAWKAACDFQGDDATFVVPKGETFLLGPLNFFGPCYGESSPSVEINGTLKALPDRDDFHDEPWITFRGLNNLTVSGGGTGIIDGQGSPTWPTNTCHVDPFCKVPSTSMKFERVSNSTVHGLIFVDSKGFHMNFHQCDHIHIHNLQIVAPKHSPNTDGIHVGITDHIRITNSTIGTGDDCISLGPGSTNVFASNIVCGPGHGISVGSLGKHPDEMDVTGLYVKNSTIMNTSNGVRIKTWQGSPPSRAMNFTFENIIMINVSNPIIIDQEYCPGLFNCSNEPSKVEISNVNFYRISGTSSTTVAVNLLCSKDVPCKQVELLDIMLVCSDVGCNTSTASSCTNVDGSSSGLQIPTPCLS